MNIRLQEKLHILKENIQRMDSVAVAFSGGVDSTFLLKVAHDLLKEEAIAVTAKSAIFPEGELKEATGFTRDLGIEHIIVAFNPFAIAGFADNPVDRCYLCKRELFGQINKVARQNKIKYVVDGSNIDDLGDHRPGRKAIEELGIICPLQEVAMTKNDIRMLSRQMDLPTWDKPVLACLASRFPYGEKITKEKLAMIESLEQYLKDCGFRQVRVRCHGDVARIEVAADERNKFFDTGFMDKVDEKSKEKGFVYVALDLKGYRTGSMNEVIKPEKDLKGLSNAKR
jgi:uncharacterized protein